MLRRSTTIGAIVIATLAIPTAALACGGLVAPNGAVQLVRTTTLAGYHHGTEHYVTSFEFAGGEGEFGSIVPLPGVPSKIERGGDWTLQRLIREVRPVTDSLAFAAAAEAPKSAKVLIETSVDALDITVLEGGANEVIVWAEDNGFDLSDDAPEVLAAYAARSPYFMAARFDAERAKQLDQRIGDGTPIHLTIPTENPWVPLHILSLAKGAGAPVEADVFLLTDREPALLPAPRGAGSVGVPVAPGLRLNRSEEASPSLVADLRSDKGMGWIPKSGMWFTHLALDAPAADVTYDLAIDASGRAQPSWFRAGFLPNGLRAPQPPAGPNTWPVWIGVAALVAWALGGSLERARALGRMRAR